METCSSPRYQLCTGSQTDRRLIVRGTVWKTSSVLYKGTHYAQRGSVCSTLTITPSHPHSAPSLSPPHILTFSRAMHPHSAPSLCTLTLTSVHCPTDTPSHLHSCPHTLHAPVTPSHLSLTPSHAPFTPSQVEVEVEAVDKGGNFLGWLFIDGKNLSLTLVEV